VRWVPHHQPHVYSGPILYRSSIQEGSIEKNMVYLVLRSKITSAQRYFGFGHSKIKRNSTRVVENSCNCGRLNTNFKCVFGCPCDHNGVSAHKNCPLWEVCITTLFLIQPEFFVHLIRKSPIYR